MNKELISVIMCIYKEPMEYIHSSIQSVLLQTYENIELIVIIDNKKREDVVSYIEKLKDERVQYYENEENEGLVISLNKALKVCRGSYIARMDADDISVLDRIQEQYTYCKDNNIDLLGGRVTVIDQKGKPVGRICPPETNKYIKEYIRNGGTVPHPTWFVKSNVFKELQGYRNIEYAEDFDFLNRAIIGGYKVGCLKRNVLFYRQNINGISQGNKGKQVIINRILRLQCKKNEVFTLRQINEMISLKNSQIQRAKVFYYKSRKLHNWLKGENVTIEWRDFCDVFFSRQLYEDLFDELLRKMICYGELL